MSLVKVIFIGGTGRSGSTLLDRLIGQLPGYVSVGELRTVWGAGIRENRLCGCGQPFSDCPFWSRVGDTAFGGWANVDPVAIEDALDSITHLDALRHMARRTDGTRLVDGAVVEQLERLYAAISATAGGATIIDSSKGPRYGLLVSSLPGISMRSIHLVRDSRGVAYSWSKEIMRPDTPGRSVPMLRMGIPGTAARWVVQNTFMELLGRRIPVVRLRYETLLERPGDRLRQALTRLGEELPTDLAFLDTGSVELKPNHTVMGNPMRMTSGTVRLRTDDAWRRELRAGPRIAVTALTAPWLVRYGYHLRMGSELNQDPEDEVRPQHAPERSGAQDSGAEDDAGQAHEQDGQGRA